MDTRHKIWFYRNTELKELIIPFSEIFECDDLEDDYENVWEWVEGYSRKFKAGINISRAHENWEARMLTKPIMILMIFDEPVYDTLPSIETIAKLISDKLNETVYFGYSTLGNDDEYTYQEVGRFDKSK